MIAYGLRRLASAIPTLFVIITLAFFMMRAAPGGPFDSQRKLTPEVERNIKAAYDLDKPLWRQYVIYLGKVAHGDLGPSYKNQDFTVVQLIGTGLPVSALIGTLAMTLALLVGTTLGTLAALHQNRWPDYSVMTAAILGITIPSFVTAPILTLLLGIYAGLLPVGGWNGGAWRNILLPVAVLSLPQIAIVARMIRGSMVEVLHANYIRTARAKGLSTRRIVLGHALRAAILPLISYLAPALAAVLTGSLIVEQIFGLPGIGRYFVQGALNRDYTLVLGVVICYATLIIALNFLADMLLAFLDPRARLK
jgi:oligopeptide transport system permease protein